MHEHHGTVLHTAIADALKMERRLKRRIPHHARRAIETIAIEMESLDEEVGLVEARGSKAGMVALHVLLEIAAVLLGKARGAQRQRIHVVCRRDIDIKLIVVVQVVTSVHEPFWIAEDGNLQARILHDHAIEFGKDNVEFCRTAGIEHNDVAVGSREALHEGTLVGAQVGDGILNSLLFQLTAKGRGERAFGAGRVVAVDDNGMMVLETLIKAIDESLVEGVAILVDLIELGVVVNLLGIDGEWYQHSDTVFFGKVTQGLHLLGIQGTDNQVAVCGVFIQQRDADVGTFSNIPGAYVGGDALSTQTVTGHEHATVVLNHALAVTVFIVQGQHDTDAQRP